jgi:hypothetical protein
MHRLAIVTALALASPAARATVLLQLSTGELTRQAAVVARGTVIQQRVVSADGRLWTDSTVRVSARVKGPTRSGQTLTLRQPGGELGRVGMRVAGVARFRVGEEILIFAAAAGPVHVPVGMCQGKFELRRDRAGVLRARRDLSGAGLVRFAPDGRMLLDHRHAPEAERPLADLLGEVRAALRGGAR